MKHLDLFSGIGGFAYAADQVFGDVTHFFCDNDKFCQAVLRKHWPESEIYDDIRQITADTYREGQLQQEGEQQEVRGWLGNRVDLLTGGFPCQPFSTAGLRRGIDDGRYLWPEMLRVIQLAEPTWIIAENVRGLTTWNDGLVLETVCADLEAANYEVQPLVVPAVGVNAPHRRDRIWFVARNTRHGHGAAWAARSTQKPERPPANARGFDWSEDWAKVAAELCSVDDGLPVELGGLKLTKAQHRGAQLKAYGNAIVPQVAMQVMEAIKEADAA